MFALSNMALHKQNIHTVHIRECIFKRCQHQTKGIPQFVRKEKAYKSGTYILNDWYFLIQLYLWVANVYVICETLTMYNVIISIKIYFLGKTFEKISLTNISHTFCCYINKTNNTTTTFPPPSQKNLKLSFKNGKICLSI